MKAERVGINMMDITVCGALPPYNSLLGGKLICLLLCSPEVGQQYAKRYGNQPSLIASSMRGAAVTRRPDLVFLGTTSLYGTGSSQYNRIKVNGVEFGGDHGDVLEFRELGCSEGFGSFHFSRETVDVMDVLLARAHEGRRVNSIFGEGVNPLMRKIREALDAVGLNSDVVLRHGNRRIVYGVALAKNFSDFMLGIEKRPKYLVPHSHSQESTTRLASYWRRRWLSRRITQPEILNGLYEHALVYPIRHGARVPPVWEELETVARWA